NVMAPQIVCEKDDEVRLAASAPRLGNSVDRCHRGGGCQKIAAGEQAQKRISRDIIAAIPRPQIALAILAAALLLRSQTSTGQIDIIVQDSSGGVIPKAVITLMGSDTGNLARTVSTNEAGLAEVPLLPPGSYDIAITAAGFEKLVR